MSEALQQSRIDEINSLDAEKRLQYCIKEIVKNRQVWILKDDDGCVMLNSEEDDCVPVWPNREFAQQWISDGWDNCVAESISLNKWHSRWTYGLEDDQLSVAVFPNINEEGVILFPDEFDFELKRESNKR